MHSKEGQWKRERERGIGKNGIEFDKHVFWCWVFNSFSVSVLFSLFLVILTYLTKYIYKTTLILIVFLFLLKTKEAKAKL